MKQCSDQISITIIIDITGVNVQESMGKSPQLILTFSTTRSCDYTYQYYKLHENLSQVRAMSEHAMKLGVCMIKSLLPSSTGKYHEFVAVCIVTIAQYE